ncbi:hypothetical protein FIA58_001110 [Flavobacterium jejuense]|uniref:Tetratricopeptide repeat protein n=1 Tax=Flavobacterium jejuense TaxID=1544455 RepID=A0ABX0IKL3_9FLAO|nr:hypothetical protein [Flavobacterium jejuense]NHN24263.1 hypothetical protein [Flavobacterium jejuense]
MKQLFLGVVALISITTFGQKDELKVLKKIYNKDVISNEDLNNYKEASDKLNAIASSESDKVYAKLFKVMYTAVEFDSKGANATMKDKAKLFNPDFLAEYGVTIDKTIAFEKKSGKKIYSDDLIRKKYEFRDFLYGNASRLFQESNYREASLMFHNLYVFDPKNEGIALNNSAELAVQAQDYLLAEKFYEDLKESNYLKNGINYYATPKTTGKESLYPNKEDRDRQVQLGLTENPREEKMSSKKPEIYKMLALIALQNKDIEKTKKTLAEAKVLNPNDSELIDAEFQLYFTLGYDYLKDDSKLVDEINASVADKAKYDQLMEKRKKLFKSSLPYLEKAYQLKATDGNTKILLRSAYEILDMKDKAATIN